MKYLKAFLIVMLTVFTFGSAMAEAGVYQSDHHSRHHRHHRHHQPKDDHHQGDDHR